MKRVRVIYVEDASTASTLRSALQKEGLHPGPVTGADSEGFEVAEGGFYVDVPENEVAAAETRLIGLGHKDDILRRSPDD